MKTSVYQFFCTGSPHGGGSTKLLENKLFMSGSLYASTRDFSDFEISRYSDIYAWGIGVEADMEFKVGQIYQFGEDDDKNIVPIIVWYRNDCTYLGIQYLGQYPLILEILPDSKWFRIFYNDECKEIIDFVNSFKDKYDFKMQFSIMLALSRLNVSIALDHVDIPGLCPAIF